MIVYHGSTLCVQNPRILTGNRMLDFGVGFYTTRSYEQAERWAKVRIHRAKAKLGAVSVYAFDYDGAAAAGWIREFQQADAEWLDFVVANRRGSKPEDDAMIHIGPVADDSVYATIQLYETGILNSHETIRRLRTEALADQIVFHTEEALRLCRFVECREIGV